MSRFAFLLFAASVLCVGAAEPVRLSDTAGQFHEPLKAAAGRKATVVIFTLPDCPIANAYAPEVNRLVADYSAKGVGFYLAHADRTVATADARKHAADYGFRCPVLLDTQHALVRALGATKTPQAFLLDAGGRTVYRGRINNLYADFGQRRQTVTQHDLRDALDAVLAGRPVPRPATEAIGCLIQTTATSPKP